MKKIVVTGGTGFVGSNLVHRLVSEGYKPVLLQRGNSNLWRLQDILPKLEIVETDLLSKESVFRVISKIKPNLVFHLAAYGANQSIDQDISKLFATNILGTVNLLMACQKTNVGYFVNTGSSSEYGLKNSPMHEDDPLLPVNYYAVTKISSTLAASVFSKTNALPLATLRLFSPYGSYEDIHRFSTTVILNGIRKKRIQLSRPSYVRDFVYIDDVVDAYMTFVQTKKKMYGEVFNIGSGVSTPLGSFVQATESVLGCKLPVTWAKHHSNQQEPTRWQADIKKACRTLAWKPKTTLKQGIEKSIEWFTSHDTMYT